MLQESEQKKLLMSFIIKINDYARENPTQMLFKIMTLLPVKREDKLEILAIESFNERLTKVRELVDQKLKEIASKKQVDGSVFAQSKIRPIEKSSRMARRDRDSSGDEVA
jgi:ATP-dependent Lon protease